MSDINSLRTWEKCAPCPIESTPDSFFIQSNTNANKNCLYVAGNNNIYNYSAVTDGWTKLTDSYLTGDFGPGSCGVYHPKSFTAVAQEGSGGSIWPDPYAGGENGATFVTNLNILTNMRLQNPYENIYNKEGFYGIIQSGVDKGKIVGIVGNTVGFNSILYIVLDGGIVPSVQPGTVIDFYTGRYYLFNGGSVQGSNFKYFDYATQTWSSGLSVTNLPPTWLGSGSMEVLINGLSYYTSGSDGSTSTEIKNSNSIIKFPINAWTGAIARVDFGDLPLHEKRVVVSNTGDSVTVSPGFSGSTLGSGFYLSGNEDLIYLTGNNSDILYTYSITNNIWSVLPVTANRTGNHSKASNLSWVSFSKSNETHFSTSLRKIISFRCNNTRILDSYDIPSGQWEEALYSGNELFTNESSFAMGQTIQNEFIYCQINPVAGEYPRFIGYSVSKKTLVGYGSIPSILNTIIDGKRLFILESAKFSTIGNKKYLYYLMPSSKKMFRAEVD